MTYKFRVSLPGIKGFSRLYEVNGRNSLHHFHMQMLSDMEFPRDLVVLFKAFNEKGDVVARYAGIDIGDGAIDEITIQHTVEKGIVTFTYFFDPTNKKSVILTLESCDEKGKVQKPVLLESKGPNPEEFFNGYVAFEDLPPQKRRVPEEDEDFEDDDCEDEDDEDDDDSEDFQEKYDEDED